MSSPFFSELWLPAQIDEQLAALEQRRLTQPELVRAELLALIEQAQSSHLRGQQAFALCLLAECVCSQGDYAAALTAGQEALELSRELGIQTLVARCLGSLGLTQSRLAQYDQAMQVFMESLQLALSEKDEGNRSRALIHIALIHNELEEYHQALDLLRDAMDTAQRNGFMPFANDALVGMIGVLQRMGEHRESQRLVTKALQWAKTYRLPRAECKVLYHQAVNLLALEKVEASRSSAERCLELAVGIGHRETVMGGQQILGEIHLTLGHLDRAQQCLTRSEGLARELGIKTAEAQANASLSRLFEQQGDYRRALEYARAQQNIDTEVRAHLVKQRALVLARQIKVEVLRRESELQRERNDELARANSTLRQTQIELTRRASQDQLTGLANRSFFWRRAQRALEYLPPGRSLGLIFADIDHLKAVNDRYGHAGGDRLISELARRMEATVRSSDLVGRLSGDEFMILLTEMTNRRDIALVADKLLHALREPIEFQGKHISPTLSLGCVVAPDDGSTMEILHKHADLALYEAKARGRNTAVHFAPHMSVQEQERRQLEQDLRSAIRAGELELHYQGQFALPGKQLSGFEALVRWRHPEKGMIPPDRFISLAEESHLILELGRWVLREACRQAREWRLPERGISMAVNVSVREFGEEDFVQSVEECLREYALPGTCLILELTESMVHHDPRQAAESVSRLQALGVEIAMDDFGTGYSSLSMLKNLPFEQLKIDREFLRDLNHDSSKFAAAQQFIEVIVSFAHNLRMRVLAEGVETEEQYNLLCKMGCDEAQGYWLARPLPSLQAAQLLAGF